MDGRVICAGVQLKDLLAAESTESAEECEKELKKRATALSLPSASSVDSAANNQLSFFGQAQSLPSRLVERRVARAGVQLKDLLAAESTESAEEDEKELKQWVAS